MSETQDSDEGMDGFTIDLTLEDTDSDDEEDVYTLSRQGLRRQTRRQTRRRLRKMSRENDVPAAGIRHNVTFSSQEESLDSEGDGFSANETSDSELKSPAMKRVRENTKIKQTKAAKKKMKATNENVELGMLSKRNFEPLRVIEELEQVFYLRWFFSNDQLKVLKRKPSYEGPIKRIEPQNGVDFELFCDKFHSENKARQGRMNFCNKDGSE